MVSTLYSNESTVVLVEYPPGDSSEYTLDSMESQPQRKPNEICLSVATTIQQFKVLLIFLMGGKIGGFWCLTIRKR